MSYFLDDDASQVRDLKDRLEKLQSDILSTQFSVSQENVESGQSIFPIANPSARGGGGSGASEPYITTLQTPSSSSGTLTIDLNYHTHTVTVDEDITTIAFSNVPTSGSSRQFTIRFNHDGVGGTFTVTFPASAGSLSFTLSSGESARYVLHTEDGGTSYEIQTLIGASFSGDLSQWATFPAIQDVDMDDNDIIGVHNIDFDGVAATIQGLYNLDFFQADQSINSLSGELDYQVSALDKHQFIAGAVPILEITDTTGLTMLGTHVINMGKNIINTIGSVQFDNTVGFSPVAVNTIGFDSVSNALKYNVALTTDIHQFHAAGELLGGITRVASNSGQLTIDNVVSDLLQADEQLFLSSASTPSPLLNGAIWRDSGTGIFKARQNGVTENLIGGSQTPWTSNIDADAFDLQDLGGISFTDGHTLTTTGTTILLDLSASGDTLTFEYGDTAKNHTFSNNTEAATSDNSSYQFTSTYTSPTIPDDTQIATYLWKATTVGGTPVNEIFGSMIIKVTDITTGTEDSDIDFTVKDGGIDRNILRLDGSQNRLYLPSGARIDLNGGDLDDIGNFSMNSTPDITGSRGGNAALASLLTALENEGLITDSTT